MKTYVVHAFTENSSGGNPAGVVFLPEAQKLSEQQMQNIAAELNFSETAFIRQKEERTFFIRYFTPVCEVPVCGHATIASFSFLRQKEIIGDGGYTLLTKDETLKIEVSGELVWMEMAKPVLEDEIDMQITKQICDAYELEMSELSEILPPRIVRAGIRDIHLCLKNKDSLIRAKQHSDKIASLSEQLDVAGVHMSCLSDQGEVTAYCSNFAPYYGIEEECATGTSNAGLTFYLYSRELILPEQENCFLQGEHMGQPSKIYSRIRLVNGIPTVWIGGQAIITGIK